MSDEKEEVVEIIVEKADEGERLDLFLKSKLTDLTRSQIKNLIENENVVVDNISCKAGIKLKSGQCVKVQLLPPKEISIEKEDIPLDIVYEDADLAVINKPQGMVVHPAVGNYSGTLVNALLYSITDLSGINGEIRPGIVHRLDKDTSGLLVVAKNDKAHLSLQNQIQTKVCKRFYRAIIIGSLKDDDGVIETYIGRSLKDRKKMAVTTSDKGRIAITHYKVLERFRGFCYVEFELKTGRTHQIRVHCASLNAPILGDFVYAEKQKNIFNLKGQLLHAYKLQFLQPTTNEQLSFEVELPNYFKEVLEILRKKYAK